MIPIWVWAAIGLAVFAAGNVTGWTGRGWKADSDELALKESQEEVANLARRAMANQATAHAAHREKVDDARRNITAEVQDATKTDPAAACLAADSLRSLNATIQASRDRGWPEAALPASAAASAGR